MAFHQKVREGYRQVVESDPQRIVVLDANRPIHMVEQDIIQTLKDRILKDF
ncbi:thymidylate kinase [compost metagenome]